MSSRNSTTPNGSHRSSKTNEVSYLSREEQYKRMNDELEAKTANLVKEAEEVMKAQNSILSSKSRLLDNIDTQDFLRGFEDDTPIPDDSFTDRNNHDPHLTHDSTRPSSRPASNKGRPSSKDKNLPPSKPRTSKSNLPPDNVHEALSMADTIDMIAGQISRGQLSMEESVDDDVIPPVAADIGAEAQMRFLKAKLRVMQEELDNLGEACKKKDEESSQLQGKIREREEERVRLNRLSATQQGQIDKYKKLAEDNGVKSASTEGQLTALRKEYETLKRSQKQQTSAQSVTDVRLHRALEEVAKYKEQLQKAKSAGKESGDQERKKMEALMADNKRLEKQKNDLMTGFKKQLKLIDVLKRQKMHIEAAKMLSFSEEEFVKALEWGN